MLETTREWKAESPAICSLGGLPMLSGVMLDSCLTFDLVFGVSLTLGLGMVIIIIRPLTEV